MNPTKAKIILSHKKTSTDQWSSITGYSLGLMTPKSFFCDMQWYHNALCHLGKTCMELSVALYFFWKNLQWRLLFQKKQEMIQQFES